jgi:DNA-directed RNA polymerase II subunit RPB1
VASKTGVTRGVPRIEEILRLTKNPKNPSMTVFMNPQEEMDIEKVNNYAVALTHTKLIDVVQSVQVYFDPMEQSTQIEEDRVLLEQFYQFEEMVAECLGEDGTAETGAEPAKSKWVIRMEIDKEILIEKNLTMDDIHFAVANSHYGKDVHCVFSDYNMDKLVFRIRTNANIFDKKPKRGVANPLDQSDEIYLLKNFQDALLNQIVLRGIHGVKNVLSRKLQNMVVKEEGKYVRKDTWVLDSTGSNLLDTLALDFIDATRTTTNDIKEVFDVLGIEAARKCIHTELVDVMAAAGASINYHHTSLLCDRMTCNKDMVSIFRSGLLNDNVGPIAKATFEVHTEVFLDAARHAEFDHMKGVSANIMCGQQGDYGTNAFQVVLDMKAYESLKGEAYQRRDVSREIEEGLVAPADDTTCGTRIEIQNNIASIRRTTDHGAACLDDGYNIGF